MLDKIQKAIGVGQVASGNLMGLSSASKKGSVGANFGAIQDAVGQVGMKAAGAGALDAKPAMPNMDEEISQTAMGRRLLNTRSPKTF